MAVVREQTWPQRLLRSRACKPLVFPLALAPALWLVWAAANGGLGSNPAEALIRGTGEWTLRMLCVALAVTPLRELTGWTALARLRRMLGLFAFFYACVHLSAYAWLDMGFDLPALWRDVGKRPFIFVGMAAWALLLPLALTSFQAAVRALGGRRWQGLHRLVYGVAGLALLHFFWMRAGKQDFAEVWVYCAIVAALLGWRLLRWGRRAAQQRRGQGAAIEA